MEKDYSNIVIQCTEQRIWYLPGILIAFILCLEFLFLIFDTLIYAMKDLTAQVSSENDPVSFLPKVVALLFLQVSLIIYFLLFISQIVILYCHIDLICNLF